MHLKYGYIEKEAMYIVIMMPVHMYHICWCSLYWIKHNKDCFEKRGGGDEGEVKYKHDLKKDNRKKIINFNWTL